MIRLLLSGLPLVLMTRCLGMVAMTRLQIDTKPTDFTSHHKTIQTSMSHPNEPSPLLAFDTISAYQKTAAIKAAIELKIFTHIAAGATKASAIAARASAAERGIRILCDSLTAFGFLAKTDQGYALTPESAAFLDENS